jgi:hypothetical protein
MTVCGSFMSAPTGRGESIRRQLERHVHSGTSDLDYLSVEH